MPRPSSQADQALLASGRALYAQAGCAGLSVRKVAEHAGVRPGLFHYHFASKDVFLQAVLQGIYEDVYAVLAQAAGENAPALERLETVLLLLGRFLREQGAVIGRIVADVAQGQVAAQAFVRTNAPRHLALLAGLMDAAEREGSIAPMPTLRRMGFVMGAVAAPLIVGRGLQLLQAPHTLLVSRLQPDMLSDEATRDRVALVLKALQTAKEAS